MTTVLDKASSDGCRCEERLLREFDGKLADLLVRPRWWVGFSGGLDSTVLLTLVRDYLAAQRRATRPALIALHIHHGLSPVADDWQNHCEAVCAALGVPLRSVSVEVDRQARGGLEAAARRARYAAFDQLQQPNDILLLGHHRDDQVETVLLKLFRSSAVTGLAAMRERSGADAKLRVRPLLSVGRDELLCCARARDLSWIEDESNRDERLSRNFVRHRVLPLLSEHWPHCRRQLLTLSQAAADTALLLDEVADQDLAAVAASDRWGPKLQLTPLRKLSRPRIRNALTRWLHALGAPALRQRQWPVFFDQLLTAPADRTPVLTLPGGSLRPYQRALYWVPEPLCGGGGMPGPAMVRDAAPCWDMQASLMLPGGGSLVAEPDRCGRGLVEGYYRIRQRQGGERLRTLRHSQTLKRFLSEAGVPPWWRDRVPLLYSVPRQGAEAQQGEQLAAVADLGVCSDFRSPPGRVGYRLHWLTGAAGQ